MIVDEDVLGPAERDGSQAFDVVVVGAGAAGLTLTQALGARLRILVIEAGGLKETPESRADYGGTVAPGSAHPAADLYRVRALGGTSRIWGGRCIPYDPIDFAARPWVPGAGWPLPYRSLAPYYPAASAAAESGRFDFDPASALPGQQRAFLPGLDGDLVQTTLERFSRPTNFWTRFRDVLLRAPNVLVLPATPVTGIRLGPDGRTVEAIEVVTRTGRHRRIRASAYVLALGGLETTRLLLASNDVRPAGIGNDGDQLGRCYMSHLCTAASTVTFSGPAAQVAHDYARDPDGIYLRRRLWLTEAAQRRHLLLNVTFRTYLPEPGDPAHRDPVLSAMFLAKSFVQREYAAKFSESPVGVSGYARHVANVARAPLPLARFARRWLRDRVLAERKLPSVVLAGLDNTYALEFHAEQAPNPDSRVTLGPERDRHGLPRLRIDWRITDADVASLQRAHALLASELTRTGTGRLDADPERIADRARRHGIVGGHHIGLTRMSGHPRDGVVDGDCRVHGLPNLYVASASVLPTSGQANPTLTVLALTLRLADHLSGRLGAHAAADHHAAVA